MTEYLATGSVSTDSILYAIDHAKRNGMVPFVVLMPVSPEFLMDAAGDIEEMLAQEAADRMRRSVRSWKESQTAHETAHDPDQTQT